MKARREYRNRREVEVAVLDALVDRSEEGMTVFELRAAVDADIDAIETALSRLKSDDLIDVREADGRVVIMPADCVVPDPGENPNGNLGRVEAIREAIGAVAVRIRRAILRR